MATYTVMHVAAPPSSEKDWNDIPAATISHFRPEGSDFQPSTQARLVYTKEGLHGRFDVKDKYLLARFTKLHDPVWTDSAVELFVQPKTSQGYFNFEFNGLGTLTTYYVRDCTKTKDGFKDATKLTEVDCKLIVTKGSIAEATTKEISEETEWWLEFHVPFALLEKYVGALGRVASQEWKGNFYKCAEDCSHPHWGAWSPVDQLNFHLPHCFGTLVFGEE